MSLPPPIVQTATRTRSLTTPKSDITVVPFPPENPTLAVIRTSGQIGIPLPHNLPNIPAYQAWSGIPISTSFREQAMKTFENIRACLALAAATPRDITKMTVYLESRLDRKRTVQLDEAMGGFLTDDKGDVHRPACTILNVNGLSGEAGRVKIMVEVEAVVRWRKGMIQF